MSQTITGTPGSSLPLSVTAPLNGDAGTDVSVNTALTSLTSGMATLDSWFGTSGIGARKLFRTSATLAALKALATPLYDGEIVLVDGGTPGTNYGVYRYNTSSTLPDASPWHLKSTTGAGGWDIVAAGSAVIQGASYYATGKQVASVDANGRNTSFFTGQPDYGSSIYVSGTSSFSTAGSYIVQTTAATSPSTGGSTTSGLTVASNDKYIVDGTFSWNIPSFSNANSITLTVGLRYATSTDNGSNWSIWYNAVADITSYSFAYNATLSFMQANYSMPALLGPPWGTSVNAVKFGVFAQQVGSGVNASVSALATIRAMRLIA